MTFAIRPRRSVLYMPGSNRRAIEKARALPADALILDLEDAVAPESKADARAQVCEAVNAGGFGKREVIIRINALSTPWGEQDFDEAIAARPSAILIPKVSSASVIEDVSARLPSGIAVWAMIETPRAILEIATIAAAGGKLECLVMGTNDLLKELRGTHMPGRENLGAALGLSVAAARACRLAIIDGVFNDIADAAGFSAICRQGRAFGFDGKTLIHPSQIDSCNEIFSPSPSEVETARTIIAAFDNPQNRNKGAIVVDGRMVERLHMEMARVTVAFAQAIAERNAG